MGFAGLAAGPTQRTLSVHRYRFLFVAGAVAVAVLLCLVALNDKERFRTIFVADYEASIEPTSLSYKIAHSPKFQREFLVTAFTNAGMLNMTLNWLISLQRVGIDVRMPLLICFDERSYTFLRELSLNVYRFTNETLAEIGRPSTSFTSSMTEFRSLTYNTLVQTKMFVNAYIVSQGVPLIFSDVDLVLLRRTPANAFVDMVSSLNEAGAQRNISMLMQADGGLENLCTGFFIVRPTTAINQLFGRVVADMTASKMTVNDQEVFNIVCRNVTCYKYVDILNADTYRRGSSFFHNHDENSARISSKWAYNGDAQERSFPLMVHANWLTADNKIPKLREFSLWFVENEAYVQRFADVLNLWRPFQLPQVL